MAEHAVHLSKARLAGRTLSNRERKPRICETRINMSKSDTKQTSKKHAKKRALKYHVYINYEHCKLELCEGNKGSIENKSNREKC